MSLSSGAFSRAASRLFAHYGEEAVLRGAEPVVAVESHDVEILGEYGQVEQIVTTVTLMTAAGAKAGDPITVGSSAWVLDKPLRGDGHTTEFIVRPAA